MVIKETTVWLNREHCRNLQREAEWERLIQVAGRRQSSAWDLSLPRFEVGFGKLKRWAGLTSPRLTPLD